MPFTALFLRAGTVKSIYWYLMDFFCGSLKLDSRQTPTTNILQAFDVPFLKFKFGSPKFNQCGQPKCVCRVIPQGCGLLFFSINYYFFETLPFAWDIGTMACRLFYNALLIFYQSFLHSSLHLSLKRFQLSTMFRISWTTLSTKTILGFMTFSVFYRLQKRQLCQFRNPS